MSVPSCQEIAAEAKPKKTEKPAQRLGSPGGGHSSAPLGWQTCALNMFKANNMEIIWTIYHNI